MLLTGHHLVALIRAWQDSLIQAAAQNGAPVFQFNTYIISVLVIFFYQNYQKFPKIANVPSLPAKSIDKVPLVNVNKLQRAVRQFFQFYGKIYGMNHKIISINTGRLEDRFLKHYKQNHLTREQKRFVRIKRRSNFNQRFLCLFHALIFPLLVFVMVSNRMHRIGETVQCLYKT